MPGIKEHLLKDHQEHERLLRRITQSLAANEPPEKLRERWLPFERNLLDHLHTEERYLFAVIAQAHREEVDALRAEHRRIRYAVAELSVSVELHAVTKAALDNLSNMLRKHCEREDRSLHEWLEMDEGICAHRGLVAMLERRARAAEQFHVLSESPDSSR